MHTRGGQRLWSIPYPQEVNDIPMIIGRQMDGKALPNWSPTILRKCCNWGVVSHWRWG